MKELAIKIKEFIDLKGIANGWEKALKHCKEEVDEALDSGEHVEFCDIQLLLISAYIQKYGVENIDNLIFGAMDKLLSRLDTNYIKGEDGIFRHEKQPNQ